MSEFWTGKHVLVTGAGGFIGSHLVEALVKSGAHVKAFVRYNSRQDPGLLRFLPKEIFNQVEILAGDLRDPDAVQKAVRSEEIVYHLGALISIPYSYKHPIEVIEANVMGSLNMLVACRDQSISRLVHTSTSEVYGTARYTPIDENHPLQGQSPYSASKISADKLAESFYATYSLPVVILRPFNTYGPRQSARAVIPAIITQTLSKNEIMLGNLETRRDFTFVDDTVSGFLRAGMAPGVEGETFNLGTGQDIRIYDIAQTIQQIVGRSVEIKLDTNRLRPEKSEVQLLISNYDKAYQKLGWHAVTPLDQGLIQTVNWIKDNLSIYRVGNYEF